MGQDEVFWQGEGDRWFERNRVAIAEPKFDRISHILETLGERAPIGSALDLGCANGWRLARLRKRFPQHPLTRCVGVDVSQSALRDGRRQYPDIEFIRGALTNIPLQESFDLVIVNFVLHWIGREHLARALAEIDRVVKDNGLLILSDFLPNGPVRTPYHHLPDQEVFTYKQDYPHLFEALGIYREIARLTFDTDEPGYQVQSATSRSRAVCSALRKSLHDYYDSAPTTKVAVAPPPAS